MDRLYGGVCYAGIDTDPELKYPKGAGRVAFSNQQSYIAAISARFVQLQHGDIEKRVWKNRMNSLTCSIPKLTHTYIIRTDPFLSRIYLRFYPQHISLSLYVKLFRFFLSSIQI